MNVFLDIETIPTQPEAEAKEEAAKNIQHPAKMSKAETIKDWNEGKGKYAGAKDAAIDDEYRKSSFDGGKGEICSIAWKMEVITSTSRAKASEIDMIKAFFDLASQECNGRPPYFIGHNIPFDLQFIWRRAVILGVKPPFKLPFDGRHGKDYYDTMQAWAGYNKRISQDNLCKALGIEGKPGDICGANVWDHYKKGDIARIEEYNRSDVETVEKIYNRINFI